MVVFQPTVANAALADVRLARREPSSIVGRRQWLPPVMPHLLARGLVKVKPYVVWVLMTTKMIWSTPGVVRDKDGAAVVGCLRKPLNVKSAEMNVDGWIDGTNLDRVDIYYAGQAMVRRGIIRTDLQATVELLYACQDARSSATGIRVILNPALRDRSFCDQRLRQMQRNKPTDTLLDIMHPRK